MGPHPSVNGARHPRAVPSPGQCSRCAVLLQDLSRKDCLEAPSPGELPPTSVKLSSSPSAVGTLKRPTSLSRHASAAGFPLTSAGPRAVPKGHKTPTSYSPMEGGEGLFIDVEDISQLLTDVARFADALENLRDVVLRDGERWAGCPPGGHSGRVGLGDHRTPTASPANPWHGAVGLQGRRLQRVQNHPMPGPMGGGPCCGGCAELGAQGQRAVGGCWELRARITLLPARELFSSARFPVYSVAVPAAWQQPWTPWGTSTAPAPVPWPSLWDGDDDAQRRSGAVGLWSPGVQEAAATVAPHGEVGLLGSHGALFSANMLTYPHSPWKTAVPSCGERGVGNERGSRGNPFPTWSWGPGCCPRCIPMGC